MSGFYDASRKKEWSKEYGFDLFASHVMLKIFSLISRVPIESFGVWDKIPQPLMNGIIGLKLHSYIIAILSLIARRTFVVGTP
jgi:hypothetical protein